MFLTLSPGWCGPTRPGWHRWLSLTVPFCLVDCLLHEENFSVRCPKHKVSQSVSPSGAGGRGVPYDLQTRHWRLPPAPGLETVERPGAGGRPVPQGGPPSTVGACEKRGGKEGVCLIGKRNSKIKLNETPGFHFILMEPQFTDWCEVRLVVGLGT